MNEPTIKPDRSPIPPPTPFFSFSPITFEVPGRLATMEVRVTAPANGNHLPVLLLSHGHGASNYLASIRGYAPLVEFYATHGFVVIQVTHQDSKTLALDPSGSEGALFWRSRAQDMHFILDHLDEIEVKVPGLKGRVDKARIGAVGHSLGAHTVAMLLGQRMTDLQTKEAVDLTEPRIKAAVLLGTPGYGKDGASWVREHYPELLQNDFSTMKAPALIVVGDKDFHEFFSERKDWRADAYYLSPAPKTLLTLLGAGHSYGGISGWDAKETSDENPQRVADIQRLTWAYLRSALYPEDQAWNVVVKDMATDTHPVGAIQAK
jgi:dienelactone hydrolase